MSLRILSIPWSQGIAAPAPAASIPPWIPDFFVAPTTASPPGGTGAGTIGDPWSWTYATGTGAGTAQGDGKLPTTGAKVGVRGGTYTEKGITVTAHGSLGSGVDAQDGKLIFRNYNGE